jgi:hypothetical protein
MDAPDWLEAQADRFPAHKSFADLADYRALTRNGRRFGEDGGQRRRFDASLGGEAASAYEAAEASSKTNGCSA